MNKPQQALFKPFTRSGQELLEGVIDPVVGEVYHGWWDDSKTWFSVVILPHLGDGDWKEVGIAGKLLSSELTIPNCFKKVKADSGEEVKLTWAEGYEDGGRKVCSRQFPCLWLHNPLKVPPADQDLRLEDIPQAHVLTFVAAKDLRHPPTILPQDDLDMMRVFAYQRLAHDWKARLKAIQANKNPTPGQKTAYTVSSQAVPSKDQQHPATTTYTTGTGPLQSPHTAGGYQYRNDGSGDGWNFDPSRNGLP